MSQENVELVRRLVDAINADAIPRDLFTCDFEIRNAVTAVTDATYIAHRGRKAPAPLKQELRDHGPLVHPRNRGRKAPAPLKRGMAANRTSGGMTYGTDTPCEARNCLVESMSSR